MKGILSKIGVFFSMAAMVVANPYLVLAATNEVQSVFSGGGDGSLDDLTQKTVALGNEVKGFFMILGIVLLVVAIMLVGLLFMITKNTTKKTENKEFLVRIIIGGIILAGAVGFGSLIWSFGTGLFG